MFETPPRSVADILDGTVNEEKGLVERRIFSDPQLYELELERIFAHCWMYVGHESQIPNPGDYITTYIGEDPIIVVRDSGNIIHAFLNSCRHRGAKVCRSDKGNSRAFRCPYHGWSYSNSGDLVGVPRYKQAYYEQLDKSQWGLQAVAKLDTIGGLIFATWDPAAPSLDEYLGDMAFYLRLMSERDEDGLEVVGGVHKWNIETNWKIPSENFGGDFYHLSVTHGSSVKVGFRSAPTNDGWSIHVQNGHSFGSERGGAQQGSAAPSAYMEYVAEARKSVAEKRGQRAGEIVPIGIGNIFPNLSFMDTVRFRALRIWHPRGPDKIEVDSWCLIDKSLPRELKDAARQGYILSFGPSGMFEQDDGEIWTNITHATRGYIGRQGVYNYQLGLGHEIPVSEGLGADLPGTMGDTFMTEANQRSFYRNWKKLMMQGGSAKNGAVE